LTLWWLLARQGIPSHLRIGIRKNNEKMEAQLGGTRWDCTERPDEHHYHYSAFDAAFSSLPQEER